jgi:hypothetical protein
MFCISCQTPWSWASGKVVTKGAIHNPHYYEWMKRNGNTLPHNPADIPCGGYPAAHTLVRMPFGISKADKPFFEFHRLCQELHDMSQRTYRSHIDQTTTNNINIKFLLGDYDEKRWGQQLGKDERKKKRDQEVQEIFAAFNMVAVELINRVQNYNDGKITRFTLLPVSEAVKYLENLQVEINALITMINDALRNVSISYSYVVPYIEMDNNFYTIKTKNFSDEVKERPKAKDDENDNNDDDEKQTTEKPVIRNTISERKHNKIISSNDSDVEEFDEENDIQIAIHRSLEINS